MGLREAVKGFLWRGVQRVDDVLCKLAGIEDAYYLDFKESPNAEDLEKFRKAWTEAVTEAEDLSTSGVTLDPLFEEAWDDFAVDLDGEKLAPTEEGPAEEPKTPTPAEALAVVRPKYPLSWLHYTLTHLAIGNEVIRSRDLVKWECSGWKDTPAWVWGLAIRFLDENPEFVAKLDRHGGGWETFTGPREEPITLDSLRPSKRMLSRKQLKALPRPRPKHENPVYVHGSARQLAYTLDTDPNQIDKVLKDMQKLQGEGAKEALRIAKLQKEQLQEWFNQRMADQDLKIRSIESSIESWTNIAPATPEVAPTTLPKRDSKGRFVKG